jgi:hypothetical protein
MSNVIRLPRPRALRPTPSRLGYYLRVGRNEHREVAHILGEGERAYLGLVIDAPHAHRHRELVTEASRIGLDVVLDPKTQPAALVGGFSESLGGLPWHSGRQSVLSDFKGLEGQRRAAAIAKFASDRGFSAVLAPTHIISGAEDPWFEADLSVAAALKRMLPSNVAVFYSLAVSMQVLRDSAARQRIVEGLRRVDVDALWLKVENFGADATGEKVRAYIEALAEFHSLDIPIISDHVGGIPALSLVAFGAAGGVSHGVMVLEGFRASSWRRPPSGNPRTPPHRVYVHALDMLVSRAQAEALLNHSTRVKGQHACRNPSCCPRGARDMLEQPVRHYLYSRAREIEALGAIPHSMRVQHLMERVVRPRSDAVASAAALGVADNRLAATLQDRHIAMGRLRGALSNLAETFEPRSIAQLPLSRPQREER